MKKRYTFSALTLLFALLAIGGLIIAIVNSVELYNYFHIMPLSANNLDSCKDNQYFKVNIEEVVVQGRSAFDEVQIVSEETVIGIKTYSAVTVGIGGGEYIVIYIRDPKTFSKLEKKADNPELEDIQFIGKAGSVFGLNWYKQIFNFSSDSVGEDFYIKEMDPGATRDSLIMGVFMIALALFAMYKSIGSYVPYVEPMKEVKTYSRRKSQSYNLENELISARRKLKALEKQEQSLKKWATGGAIAIALGIFIPILRFDTGTFFVGLGLGIAGLVLVARWYLNSANEKASNIASMLSIETLYKKKLVTRAVITRIEEEIQEQKENEKRLEPIIHFEQEEEDEG